MREKNVGGRIIGMDSNLVSTKLTIS